MISSLALIDPKIEEHEKSLRKLNEQVEAVIKEFDELRQHDSNTEHKAATISSELQAKVQQILDKQQQKEQSVEQQPVAQESNSADDFAKLAARLTEFEEKTGQCFEQVKSEIKEHRPAQNEEATKVENAVDSEL